MAWYFAKGDDGLDRQPAQFMFDNSNGLHSTNSTTGSSNRATNIGMEFQQWVNVIYSKRPDGFDVYLDGVLATSYNYTGGETLSPTKATSMSVKCRVRPSVLRATSMTFRFSIAC